jgi:hypothetical protein
MLLMLIIIILLGGCSPSSIVPQAPVLVTEEKEIEKLAGEIMPGARPAGGFIAGSGIRSAAMSMALMPNMNSMGEEFRMTAFLLSFPPGLADDRAEAQAQDALMRTLSKRGWGVTPEGTKSVTAGSTTWQFRKNLVNTEGVRALQYILVKKYKTHKTVLIIQGLDNVMDEKALVTFLGNITP